MNHKDNLRVIILCGGKGERLRPLTNDIPKPLIKVNGKPILSYIIDHIKSFKLGNLIIATGYLSEKIEEFTNSEKSLTDCTIVNSGDVDIIERIKDSTEHIQGDFMLLYGDTISDIDINSLIKYHHSQSRQITMSVWPLRSQFGIVEIDGSGKVLNFLEKPILDKWINIGYFYFKYEVLKDLTSYTSFADFLFSMAEEEKLSAYKHEGIHITINTLKEHEEAEENIKNIITR
jgi:glucose-1-phosphate cytidylyltransferase